MPIPNELLNDIETELFSETGSSEMDSQKVCEKCGNQPCTCQKSVKVCEHCGKTPCQCNKTNKSNNSTKDTTMPLFDDPELNSLFADAHAPGEGAESGKEAKDPNVTEGEIAGAVSCGKKCKSAAEDLWANENPDETPAPDGEDNAGKTADGEPVDETKRKKHKSDIADLFSDELFKGEPKVEGDGETTPKPEDDDENNTEDDDDIDNEAAAIELELASEEAALDFDF